MSTSYSTINTADLSSIEASASSSLYLSSLSMSTTSGSVRQRGGHNAKKTSSTAAPTREAQPGSVLETPKPTSGASSEWDYKLALGVITALAFITRFWGIGHPNEVVFDEVHFGKVIFILGD